MPKRPRAPTDSETMNYNGVTPREAFNADTINPNVVKTQYAVRGIIVKMANKISAELETPEVCGSFSQYIRNDRHS